MNGEIMEVSIGLLTDLHNLWSMGVIYLGALALYIISKL
jgi:hypothetical protein